MAPRGRASVRGRAPYADAVNKVVVLFLAAVAASVVVVRARLADARRRALQWASQTDTLD